jgi:hypothetical protein
MEGFNSVSHFIEAKNGKSLLNYLDEVKNNLLRGFGRVQSTVVYNIKEWKLHKILLDKMNLPQIICDKHLLVC